ncbi:Card1-like endonuclease domain-containing protein [Nostoc sphaeroides]|uniref:DUF1887 domain-containing protein n=1 Tax=Nostoc sphaeroides CCNUC1 TaxID=2653204 RepID=A0A5P8WH85_9NOSO|nr:DUF1887 family protein [Nostoc sphaeroides]QFS51970.1 hypothetical protein GXM_09464 [Nostoc sphaeroides CCNUC1]
MNSTNPFKDYKAKHLFLLIGENPLPNYVAAMKLLEDRCIAYLVHTNQTISQKEQLTRALKNKGFRTHPVPLDKDGTDNNKSNAYKIYEIVKKYAEKIPSNERIGLHYTGGTNTMAVHAYRAISDLQPKRTDTVYSYLDARTLEIFIDTSEPEPFHRDIKLEVSLKNLFNLHKYEFKLDPLPKPILEDAAAEFVRLYQDEKIASTWRDFCHKELVKAKDSQGWWINEERTLSLTGVNQEIIKVLQNEKYKHYFAINGNQIKIKKSNVIENLNQIYAWLSGCWLEHYVLSQIKDIAEDEKFRHLNIGESQMSFVMKKSETSEGGVFEFDVAFMRSYQLFAISCTTIKNEKECKLKLFEAHTRAKQLGGDEARVALVCCCDDNPTKRQRIDRYLKSQLEGAVTNPKIAVFIREDLPNLKIKIADWVERNKGKS